MTLPGSDRSARPTRRHLVRPISPPIRDVRFWLIQGLVLGVTVLHTAVEWTERERGLSGFWQGLHHLPVPAYIVPVLLASYWFGLRGGLLTGLVTMVLSGPNTIVFHAESYEWLGEAATNALVLAVGLTVASVVEQDVRLREQAEANSRRLRTLWDVAGTLGRYDHEKMVVSDVVERLAASPPIEAAAFVPAREIEGSAVIAAGADPGLATVTRVAASGLAASPPPVDGLLTYDVATAHRSFGALLIACRPEGRTPEDSVLFSVVARELAAVMENLEHRDQERSELQRYARAMTLAQETERLRIARELHDGPVQSMIVLTRGLGHLAAQGAGARIDLEATSELRELVHDTLTSLQRTTQALRPPVLDDLGLCAAMRSLVDRRSRRGFIVARLDIVGEERRLDRDVELAAYRIAQEALTNVERHAQTDSAAVSLRFDERSLILEVVDEGVGIDVDRDRGDDHLGLVGMRERAELVGGVFHLDSKPGAGTTVRVEIPTHHREVRTETARSGG